jgi:feruloyl esterase
MILRKIFVALFPFLSMTPIAFGTTCESLKSLSLAHTTITLAQSVPAGEFSPPIRDERATSPRNTVFKELPAFCRVAATLKPSPDSNIKMELWMPLEKWNGKFQAVGNGGWAGTISYMGRNAVANGGLGGMAGALQNGYATASTDTGHDDAGAKFALGHPEKLIDYAYRAVHEMTITSKAILAAFYGEPQKLSYFNGCSTGGRQALVEAQRYPEDFDGILAGAAANPKTHLDAWRVWMAQAMFKDKDSYIPPSKYSIIHEAVLGKCDALDGVKDGLIENPMQCHFDPNVLECKAADGQQCLTKAQVATARIIMAPARDRNTGTLIFPGFEPGNELGWGQLLKGPDPYDTALDDFKYVIFGDGSWDWRTFDLQRDTAIADKAVRGTIEAVDPNLTKFAQRGGRLLMYHGWADQDIAPQASVNYYKNASNVTKATSDWVRLFMMPGMQHCQGGEGPNSFDAMAALEQWVEKGKAPDQIVASHRLRDGTVDRTRPLCPYPQVAKYKGSGSINEAANFVCSAP